jgi:hypothetical protein
MFQYAFGRRIAKETGAQVKFDLDSGFRNDVYRRRFALDVFNTEIVPANPEDIPLGMSWPTPWHRVAKAGWSAMPASWRRVVYERSPFQFDESVVPKPDRSRGNGAHCSTKSETPHVVSQNFERSAYYFGHWQHESYFAPIRDTLRREFTRRPPVREPMVALQEIMARCRSVSVHVRQDHGIRADAKVIRKARERHGACSIQYYQQAFERIGAQPDTVCFIFSDNLHWTKSNLNLPVTCRYVADECPCSDVEEILLMASCQHHVISNSSFSWWGAWLGCNPEKVVVAPRIWMRGLPETAVDICPSMWIKL